MCSHASKFALALENARTRRDLKAPLLKMHAVVCTKDGTHLFWHSGSWCMPECMYALKTACSWCMRDMHVRYEYWSAGLDFRNRILQVPISASIGLLSFFPPCLSSSARGCRFKPRRGCQLEPRRGFEPRRGCRFKPGRVPSRTSGTKYAL